MDIFLDIYDFKVRCCCDNVALLQNLKRDFSFFISKSELHDVDLKVCVYLERPPFDKIPRNTRPFIQNDKLIAYKKGYEEFFNYHYELLTLTNKSTNVTDIYSQDINFIHEMTYLYILSRSGKALDLRGFHKIHGFGISNNYHNILFLAPSKGGKSTTFLELLQSEQFSYFSDDTPLISLKGQIHPFALRVGINSDKKYHYIDYSDIYSILRKVYGAKQLIPTTAISRSIENSNDKTNIILFATRSNNIEPTQVKLSFVSAFIELIPHLIVGIGLPMIIEFFLETSVRDYFKRAQILLSRVTASFFLAFKSNSYLLYLTEDPIKNANFIKDFIKQQKR